MTSIYFSAKEFHKPPTVHVREGQSTHEVLFCNKNPNAVSIQTTIAEETKNMLEVNEMGKIFVVPQTENDRADRKTITFTLHINNVKNVKEFSINFRMVSTFSSHSLFLLISLAVVRSLFL
ncbi:hypothetical protein PRIPAC_70238 [Pristionchus pacificus]|uniref:Uncharacterized protein n=1 Tax=Pristionchus pacificus TaxID=54126 RepID=A0A2A6BEQ1_PRIPA|nr:hypothetical protein PRIPAC_70238 [Pristionchus pacificus]|eukprot:PDM64357.1 hypothetical protein PRIPAC_52613 [Pristionchus pacificus]